MLLHRAKAPPDPPEMDLTDPGLNFLFSVLSLKPE